MNLLFPDAGVHIVPITFTVGDSLTASCTVAGIGGRSKLVGLNPTYNKVSKLELLRSTHDGSETNKLLATYFPATEDQYQWKRVNPWKRVMDDLFYIGRSNMPLACEAVGLA